MSMDYKTAVAKFKSAGGVLKFSSYYKYCFHFAGEAGGVSVHGVFGGSSEDIYRFNLDARADFPLPDDEDGVAQEWHHLMITHNGEVVYEYDD